jgi:release factor glutamine methyltransferase
MIKKFAAKAKKNKELKIITDEAILSAVLNLPKEYLLSHPEVYLEKNFSPMKRKEISKMQTQILAGEPLAYVLGEKWFFGQRFFVNKDVLIPRPETELLVEYALKSIKSNQPSTIYDIGAGSGAIAISLVYNSKQKVSAIDISAKVLKGAKKNARAILGKKWQLVKFIQSDLLQKIPRISANAIICANLPYLSKSELREKSISKEPVLALHGAYKKDPSSSATIFALLKQISDKRKGNLEIFLEINYNKAKKITAFSKQLFPDCSIEIIKDYSDYERLVIIKVK